jgi:hypothetical protein
LLKTLNPNPWIPIMFLVKTPEPKPLNPDYISCQIYLSDTGGGAIRGRGWHRQSYLLPTPVPTSQIPA